MKSPPHSRRHWMMVRWILREVPKCLLALAPMFGVPPYLASECASFPADHNGDSAAGEVVAREEAPPDGEVVLSHSEWVKWNEITASLRRAQ
jgi:hypothetical protein